MAWERLSWVQGCACATLADGQAASGYRRNSSATVQTFWARDIGDPVDENMCKPSICTSYV